MRWVFCALAVIGLASPAAAADLPDFDVLRGPITVGPATFTRWNGFYAGGQLGYTNGNADFSSSTQSIVAYALRETALEAEFTPSQWPVLGPTNASTASYGGFIGYNTQWQDLVLGVEGNANRAGLTLRGLSTPIGPLTTGADSLGDTHTVTINANGAVQNIDFATLRARAGYVIGSFMPYGFGGVALGLANTAITATIHDTQCTTATPPVCNSYTFTNSYGKNGEVLYGFTVGGGVDVALTPNIFVRAEFEWNQFNPPPGILMTIATGRVGAGFKF